MLNGAGNVWCCERYSCETVKTRYFLSLDLSLEHTIAIISFSRAGNGARRKIVGRHGRN